MSNFLGPHGLQHFRLPYLSLFPGVCSNSCPLSQWCHPPISFCHRLLLLPSIFSSIMVFSSEHLIASGGQTIRTSFSINPSNGYSELISLAQRLKCLPAMRETWVRSLGREDPLEKEMATHSSILAWRIPWMEEPGGLQSMGSQRVGHDWVTSLSLSLSLSPPVWHFSSVALSFSFFLHDLQELSSQPEIEPVPQQWKSWVLTTGQPGNSLSS